MDRGGGRRRPFEDEEEEEEEEEEEANLTPAQLLNLAETHLRVRNFSLCRQYALEVQSHPHDHNRNTNHRTATQLLAVADILDNPTNFYSVLQLDTFSDDLNLIRTQFKKLVFILEPIKNSSHLAHQAFDLVHKAYYHLSDPTNKAQFDAQLRTQLHPHHVNEDNQDCFWTFCPYCFYVYQYAKVYEGCCLRCQNQTCRRPFYGVALSSLPRTDLDKGVYFSCFGFFPMGFSPENKDGSEKFESWSPIVGMFPVKRLPKKLAGRIDSNDDDDDDDDGHVNGNANADDTNFIEILDESDESEAEDKGENFNMEVPNSGPNAEKSRMMKRKSVAWSRKLMGKQGSGNGDEDDDVEFRFEENHNVGGGGGVNAEDMAFFEEDGEIYVGLPDDGAV